MQKYLLYRKGVRMAAIDRDDVKSGAQIALSDWIGRERLLLEEAGEREVFTFRYVEMGGYTAGYEGSCYWVSFSAHRPYAKKAGHHPNRTRFDAWGRVSSMRKLNISKRMRSTARSMSRPEKCRCGS